MRTDIESRINEAEVCRSMGLFADSLSIYEKVLSEVPPQEGDTFDTVKKRIGLLKREIAQSEDTGPKAVSEKEISIFKKTLSAQGDAPAILDSASAFREMGLHGEAVAEYAKVFAEDYPVEKIVPDITESLLKLHSPSKAVEELDGMLQAQNLKDARLAQIKFLMGQ